jgi:hypothetical protein
MMVWAEHFGSVTDVLYLRSMPHAFTPSAVLFLLQQEEVERRLD